MKTVLRVAVMAAATAAAFGGGLMTSACQARAHLHTATSAAGRRSAPPAGARQLTEAGVPVGSTASTTERGATPCDD